MGAVLQRCLRDVACMAWMIHYSICLCTAICIGSNARVCPLVFVGGCVGGQARGIMGCTCMHGYLFNIYICNIYIYILNIDTHVNKYILLDINI